MKMMSQTAFNFLGQDLAVLAGGHWVVAAAEIAARVRTPVTDGINILTLLIKRKKVKKKEQNFLH